MALVLPTLQQSLFLAMNSYPPTVAEAAQGLAAAYGTYAAAGQFLGGLISSVVPQQAALMQALLAAMLPLGASTSYAAAWGAGLGAFWTALPVAGANTGATIGCPGAAAAQAAILASAQGMPTTVLQAAQELAVALHTATLTVTATVSLPGPPFTIVTPII